MGGCWKGEESLENWPMPTKTSQTTPLSLLTKRRQTFNTCYVPTYMMEVAVMSHRAGGRKRRALKLWRAFILGTGALRSWHSRMWKTTKQLSSPKNMPTAWTADKWIRDTQEKDRQDKFSMSNFSLKFPLVWKEPHLDKGVGEGVLIRVFAALCWKHVCPSVKDTFEVSKLWEKSHYIPHFLEVKKYIQ